MNANYMIQGLTAIALLMTIGCADGQRQGNGSNGKGKRMVRNQGAGGKTTPRKTGDPLTSVTGNTQNEQNIDEITAGLEVGTDVTTLKLGTYQLVSSTSTFKTLGTPDFVQALVSTEFTIDQTATQNRTSAVKTLIASGTISSAVAQPHRSIVIPAQIKVTSQNNSSLLQPLLNKTLTSTIGTTSNDVTLNDALAEGAVSADFSLSAFLGGGPAKVDEKGLVSEIKQISLANGDLRFIVMTEETQASPSTNVVYRSFYLTYRLSPGPASK